MQTAASEFDQGYSTVNTTYVLRGLSCGLIMTGMRGWLVGAGPPDPSLTRFSYVKPCNRLFLYEVGT